MRLPRYLQGENLRARALRGTAIVLFSSVGSQAIRLASNLILTRLLFPEAFGMMTLIYTFMIGLEMFSDLGIHPSIIQNRRGAEADFLNTAWTVKIIRGLILWLGACALASPMAMIYGEPAILALLPVVGINALISGFATTKVPEAERELRLGKQTATALVSQIVGLIVMISIALVWPSVWALVIGGLASSVIGVLLDHKLIVGTPNRLRWDRSAVAELVGFGRFIFLSTLVAFFIAQGDKLLLGRMVSFADLGIYNIAFFMAGFPAALGSMVAGRILLPLYSQRRPSESAENAAKMRRARNLVTGSLIAMNGGLALIGVYLVALLYDERYIAAGPMLVIMAIARMPEALLVGNTNLLLAEGNSRDISILTMLQALIHLPGLIIGFWLLGIFGLMLVPGIVAIATYPFQQYFLARHNGTDIPRDAVFALIGLAAAAAALLFNWTTISEFLQLSRASAPAVTGTWAGVRLFE